MVGLFCRDRKISVSVLVLSFPCRKAHFYAFEIQLARMVGLVGLGLFSVGKQSAFVVVVFLHKVGRGLIYWRKVSLLFKLLVKLFQPFFQLVDLCHGLRLELRSEPIGVEILVGRIAADLFDALNDCGPFFLDLPDG